MMNTVFQPFYTAKQIVNSVHYLFTVDFVLRDPREDGREKVPVKLPGHREEIAVLPKPWHKSFVQSLNIARDILHVTNPCMQQVLQLWFTSFK